jgi:hypothetical protein
MKEHRLLVLMITTACLFASCASGDEQSPAAAAAVSDPILSTVDSMPERNAVIADTSISTEALPEPPHSDFSNKSVAASGSAL